MNLLKNFKQNDILMLVVAFLLGYFAHQILKGCQIVEGAEVMSTVDMMDEMESKNCNYVTTPTYIDCMTKQDPQYNLSEDQFANCLTEEYKRCFPPDV
tara:strand:+ start:203 stop:496 length:294 start_codon:yes stop_codon:yes gene_type:complete